MPFPAPSRFVRDSWDDVVAQLPEDLEALAAEHGVLKYQRSIARVSDLIRIALGYSILDLSLRSVAAWATAERICKPMSDVAVLKQLKSLRPLLNALVQRMIDPRADLAALPAGLTLVDATTVSRRGSKGTDWRINLSFAGDRGLSLGLRVTPAAVGEGIEPERLRAGDVVVGDRHYCNRGTIGTILDRGADVLIRAVRNFPLRSPDGSRCTPEFFLTATELKPGEHLERDVELVLAAGRVVPMRLLIIRKTDAATDRAKKKLNRLRHVKPGKNVTSPAAMNAAAHVFLLSSLTRDRASVGQLAAAYRFRWQIELAFKRWKSIIGLDNLRAKAELAETYILSKILCAMLIEAVLRQAAISPWGARSTRPGAATGAPWPQATVKPAPPTP